MSEYSEWSYLDDAVLVAACLNNDERAWAVLLERYGRLIYTIILRFGISVPIVDEIFQEICLILLQKLDTLQDRQRLRTWLVTVTKRTCLQYLRQKELTTSIDSLEANLIVSEPLEQQILAVEQQYLVRKAVANLDERCQYLLKALFFGTTQPSYETIAAQLEVPVGSIGPNRARCLEKLRVEILQLERATT
jgi:RNA polymerase sigma factor (sigma-70 family)